MNYQEVIDFLFSQLPVYQRDGKAAYKANLDNTIAFDNYFNNPHRNYLIIHVAGTNGKGSVSHMIASVLQQTGYKTGLYTSPHLKDFRERIKIDGAMISKESVIDFVSTNKQIIEDLKPSFFEMTVAMAFEHFSKQQVDIAVIETGMGGRLDSTNIVTPLVSVITNIGIDHTAFLGTDLKTIAGEKAGIIKSEVPVVVGEWDKVTAPVFLHKALQNKASIVFADRVREISKEISNDNEFDINFNEEPEFLKMKIDLQGNYQMKNVLTAITALNTIKDKLNISSQNIKDGLNSVVANTDLKGRWQILSENPKIICDTGHNVEGITYIINQLEREQFETLHVVLGMVNDKDIDKVLVLLPKIAKYYFTKATIPRALNQQILMDKAKEFGLEGDSFDSVELAIDTAKLAAKETDLIFIGGSTFVVAEIPEL